MTDLGFKGYLPWSGNIFHLRVTLGIVNRISEPEIYLHGCNAWAPRDSGDIPGNPHVYGGEAQVGAVVGGDQVWATTERRGIKGPMKVSRTQMWVDLIKAGVVKENLMGSPIGSCYSYGTN